MELQNIVITEKSYKKEPIFSTKLTLNFEGPNVNHIIVNTIRRTIDEYVPFYAFNPFTMKISKNTSVFNNDEMRLRMSNFPILGMTIDDSIIDYVDVLNNQEYYNESYNDAKDETVLDDSEINNEGLGTLETKNKTINVGKNTLTLFVKKENHEDELINVTTDDCDFYLNGSKIKNPYDMPHLICRIKKDEEICFSVNTKLGLPLYNQIYSPASIIAYDKLNEHSYDFILSSYHLLDEYRLLILTTRVIRNRLKYLLSLMVSMNLDTDKGVYVIDNETNTFGNLIAYALYLNPDIKNASYYKDHPAINQIKINYEKATSNSMISILTNSFNYLFNLFELIEHNLELIKKK